MQNEIRQDKIVGSRRFSNYFWSFFLFVGGLGFLLAGISSYFKVNLLPFANPTELVFIPQGLVMMFYGTLSLGFSIYIILTVVLDVGSGYNEYNKAENLVKIVQSNSKYLFMLKRRKKYTFNTGSRTNFNFRFRRRSG